MPQKHRKKSHPGKTSFVNADLKWHQSIVAYCAARGALGSINGDPRLIEEAISDLTELQKNPYLDQKTRSLTVRIKYARIFDVAVQSKGADRFRDLIEEMEAAPAVELSEQILYLVPGRKAFQPLQNRACRLNAPVQSSGVRRL